MNLFLAVKSKQSFGKKWLESRNYLPEKIMLDLKDQDCYNFSKFAIPIPLRLLIFGILQFFLYFSNNAVFLSCEWNKYQLHLIIPF